MKYDALVTPVSATRRITRTDVKKILTRLPGEDILPRVTRRQLQRDQFMARFVRHNYNFSGIISTEWNLCSRDAHELMKIRRCHEYE